MWVTITVPLEEVSGTVDITVVTATSQLNPGVFDVIVDTTTVNQVGGVQFVADEVGGGEPGEVVTYSHTLTNTGNGSATFTLTHDSDLQWDVEVPPPITLDSKQSTSVVVSVTVNPKGISGTVDTTAVTATTGLWTRRSLPLLPRATRMPTIRPPTRLRSSSKAGGSFCRPC